MRRHAWVLAVGMSSGMMAFATPLNAEPTTAPAIPDTPAGRALRAWLDAFDSGERAPIEDFHARWRSGGRRAGSS
ncbi:MAG TPA: hypothetical protein VN947_35665 [Polyangia bacterium]|nr:hypothetical protein [Polyangia bacterium]